LGSWYSYLRSLKHLARRIDRLPDTAADLEPQLDARRHAG